MQDVKIWVTEYTLNLFSLTRQALVLFPLLVQAYMKQRKQIKNCLALTSVQLNSVVGINHYQLEDVRNIVLLNALIK